MSEVKKCPKCGGTMIAGILSIREQVRPNTDLGSRLTRLCIGGWALGKEDFRYDKIAPFICESCGYIEFYLRKRVGKGKWRNKP